MISPEYVPVSPPLEPTPTGKGDQIEDELLFVGIVEQLELPVPGLRQLPRHLQKRLQIFFRFALPVPPCHRCGDTSGVRFRCFINGKRSWHLQPRYQCFSPACCCATTANPHSASTLFTLNRKKYAAHLQHHGGLYTILKNNTMILNNCNTSKSLCQATTSNLLVRRHKSPLTLLLPAATQPPAPAVYSQSPPRTMGYGLQVGAYNWTATAAVSPSTEMYSIDESAVVNWENFLSDCQEIRQEDVLKDTSCLVDTRGAFAFPSEGHLPDNMRNAHHLNLNNQSDILSSANSVISFMAAEELALKIVDSGFEHDLQSIGFLDLDSIDLPDLIESIDLPSLDFDPPFNLEATSGSPFERRGTSVTASF